MVQVRPMPNKAPVRDGAQCFILVTGQGPPPRPAAPQPQAAARPRLAGSQPARPPQVELRQTAS